MPINPMGAGSASIWYSILKSVILIVLGSLTLVILSKKFKTKDTSLTTALKINIVIVVLSFIWSLISQAVQNPAQPSVFVGVLNFVVYYVIFIVLALYLIMKFYHVNMTEAVSIWILFIITYLLINVVFSVIQITLQMKALSQTFQMQQQMQPGSTGEVQQVPLQIPSQMMPESTTGFEDIETGSGSEE